MTTPSENLPETIEQTAQKLNSEARTAQRRYLAFEGLMTEFQHLHERAPIIDSEHAAAVAQRPDVNDLSAAYPTPWTDLYLNAAANPSDFNINHCLTVTALQIANHDGKLNPQDAHLIPAIIRMFPTIRQDVAGDTDSPVELTATVGRSGINPQHLPLWWPALCKNATKTALNRVLNNATEPAEKNNLPLFHPDDLGRFMPTTRKARGLSRAQYLYTLCNQHQISIDSTLIQKFFHAVDAHATAWVPHSIRRFPQQLTPDDCNYTGAAISPDERLAIHRAAVSLTHRYDNLWADQEPTHDIIRTILRESDPTRSSLPSTLDQYADIIGNLAAMLASMNAQPLQRAEKHAVVIATIGRIIRTASIYSHTHLPHISTSQASAAFVTNALDDILILAPALPNEAVPPHLQQILVSTTQDKISTVQTLAPSSP